MENITLPFTQNQNNHTQRIIPMQAIEIQCIAVRAENANYSGDFKKHKKKRQEGSKEICNQ